MNHRVFPVDLIIYPMTNKMLILSEEGGEVNWEIGSSSKLPEQPRRARQTPSSSFKGAAPLSSRARKRPPLKSRQSTLLIPNTNTQQNHLSLRLTLSLARFAQSDSKDSTCSAINSSEDHPRTNDRIRSHARYLYRPIPTTQNSQWYITLLPESTHAYAQSQSIAHPRPNLQLHVHTRT